MKTLYTPFIDVTVNAEWSDWQDYPNGRPNPLYSQEAKEWEVDGLVFGFITLSANKKACWAAQDTMPMDWALPLANDLNAAGKKVIISFGGAVNSDISTYFSTFELVEIYQSFIDDYSAYGLDFDLENGQYNISNICEALKVVTKNNPGVAISFTLPTMPTGLTSTGVNIVKQAHNTGLTFVVNGMAMDYYSAQYRADMGKSAVDAARSIASQLASLSVSGGYSAVAVTPMIGMNDDGSMFKLHDADTLATFAKQNGMNFIGIWDFNRDNPSSYTYVDLTTSSNPEQRVAGEYCSHFVNGLTK
ncbi:MULTISPECIES: chitinase [unclassified Citrobacter]|uniref:chitinase n=1 Tax=unclassified Citrobacter TaxID=2644389 RepID=UPI0015E4A0D5|nr:MULTISPECIES: chitinase [unclassified Citrobacter]QLO86814.1 hypothetical protein HV334_24970 [Citrobacter sp. RHBSTW-00944]QLX42233.1 hypothetical protein HV135_25360 [Citrobacter sp. RHBSTW-00229]